MAAETAGHEEKLEENAIGILKWFSGLVLFLKCAFKISFLQCHRIILLLSFVCTVQLQLSIYAGTVSWDWGWHMGDSCSIQKKGRLED